MPAGPQYPDNLGVDLARVRRGVDDLEFDLDAQLGFHVPSFQFPIATGGDLYGYFLEVSTIRADFHAMQRARLERVVRQGINIWAVYATTVGTTAELRVSISGVSGTFYTSTIVIGSGASGSTRFRWRHGYPQWVDTDVLVDIEARRTGGAGFLYVYPSFGGVEQIDPRRCTSTGL